MSIWLRRRLQASNLDGRARGSTEAEAFGSVGRREQFERLAGVVDLLGAASGPEGQARSDANPFCRVYGPMSAAGRKEFLRRLQSWPARVRLKALAAARRF